MMTWKREYICVNCHGIKTPNQMKTSRICKGCSTSFAYVSIGSYESNRSTSVICNHHWPFDCRC